MNIGRAGGIPPAWSAMAKLTCEIDSLRSRADLVEVLRLKKLELVFAICGSIALGTWLYRGDYQSYGALAMICLLGMASIYLLMTSRERVYRLFACISLTVIFAAIGIALLRMSGLTG